MGRNYDDYPDFQQKLGVYKNYEKHCMRHYLLQLSYTDNLINSDDMKLIYSKLNYMYYAPLIIKKALYTLLWFGYV